MDWCDTKQIDPFNPTIPQVADFLNHLFEDKKLSVKTIQGYRSALSTTLASCTQTRLAENKDLHDLIQAMFQQRPRTIVRAPEWNLALVLKRLRDKPFEPPDKCTLQHWTWKTVFLVMLASGRRRGEIHALRDDYSRGEDWTFVRLKPGLDFVAKSHTAKNPKGAFDSVRIPALTIVGREDPEHKLCPVRAIRWYLSKTETIRKEFKEPRPLFLPVKEGKKDPIRKQTISSWIKQTITLAYERATDGDFQLVRARSHHLRALSTTWNFQHSLNLQQILDAASWASHTPFTSFYLKEMSEVKDDLYKLGPLVMAQQVIQPPTGGR